MPRTLTVEEIEDFRDDLCEVAARLFAAEGFDAVTMKAIADELGVSAMTPYRYFDGKGAIYREVRARAFELFGARVRAALAGDPDPVARLERLFSAYLEFARESPGAYRIMFELTPPPDAEPGPRDREAAEHTWNPLLSTLEDAVAQGRVAGDPLTLANLCWVHVHGLASLDIAQRLTFGRDFDELRQPLFHALLHGILTRPEGIPHEA